MIPILTVEGCDVTQKIKLRHKICLTSSEILGSAPAFSKELKSSRLPLSAAMCRGVAPPALTFTLAPAYM